MRPPGDTPCSGSAVELPEEERDDRRHSSAADDLDRNASWVWPGPRYRDLEEDQTPKDHRRDGYHQHEKQGDGIEKCPVFRAPRGPQR